MELLQFHSLIAFASVTKRHFNFSHKNYDCFLLHEAAKSAK